MSTTVKLRLSTSAKEAHDKQWYKDMLDFLDSRINLNYGTMFDSNSISLYKKLSVNYDLFNNIINKEDFEYVNKPYKSLLEESGLDSELPADFTNKDIVSTKIKVLMGMEMDRPFSWRVVAVNEEATTRKEQAEFNMYKQYVVQQIMQPIYQQVAKMDPRQAEETIKSKTPDEVKKYMEREHQDPAEMMMNQLLQYEIKRLNLKHIFNIGFKDSALAAHEIYWIGIVNDVPDVIRVNPMYFDFDRSTSSEFIEDSEWAGVEMWMSPSEVVSMFGDELSDDDIDDIYDSYNNATNDFSFSESTNTGKIRVLHRTWKALTKFGFVDYIDSETGEIVTFLIRDDEEKYYKNDPNVLNIKWEWIPEVFEGYKIDKDKYVRLRRVPGYPKNTDNIYDCKLPYVGAVYDSDNSQPTSIMDRLKVYQYYYNIIMYRIELLMASDKGKWLLMNLNMIPESAGIDLPKWLYYTDALKIGFMNPNEEGNQGGGDVTNSAKEIDMSLISDIEKYIKLAEYIEMRAGESVGITKEMEGRINQYQAVRNTQQSIQRSGFVVEPYFELHNEVKKRVLQTLTNVAKYAYSQNEKKVISYVLDDLSQAILRLDKNLLYLSEYGLFIADGIKSNQIKEAIGQLSHAAMQNQMIDLSTVVKVLKTDDILEAEEILKVGEQNMQERQQQLQTQKQKLDLQLQKEQHNFQRELWKEEEKQIILKEEERRKTELTKQAILAMGFDQNKDRNDNGVPDVLEVAKAAIDGHLKAKKQMLEEKKFEHQKEIDKKKIELEKQKIAKQKETKQIANKK